MSRARTYLSLLVLWVAITFLLTSIPDPRPELPFPHFDKLAHFGFYGVTGLLCALWRRESGSSVGRAVLAGLAFAAFVGAVDEFHQHWIPGRSMDFRDWLADAAGGGVGALFSAVLPFLVPFAFTE
jgi:VanZ family protein